MSNFFSFSQIANETHEIIIAGLATSRCAVCGVWEAALGVSERRNGKWKMRRGWQVERERERERKKMLTNQQAKSPKLRSWEAWKFNESCASGFLFLFITSLSLTRAITPDMEWFREKTHQDRSTNEEKNHQVMGKKRNRRTATREDNGRPFKNSFFDKISPPTVFVAATLDSVRSTRSLLTHSLPYY